MVRGADGGDGWSFNGEPPRMTLGLSATGAITKRDFKQYKPSGITWEELPPGNYEGAAAIKDNELDGVDAATIYPAFVGGAYNEVTDRELAVACVRAYNDWLIDDFCSADPNRLWSLAFMPVNDGVSTLVAEAERVIAKGARGLYLPLPDIAYHNSQYDPLWQMATEARVPVTIHRSGVSRAEVPLTLPDAAPGLNVVGTVQRFFSAINPISNLIFTGVFDRFPSLVFIAAEVNCGWVPALAQQMDQEFVGCRMAKEDPVLARTTTFSTDYPHSTTLWPRSKEFIAKMTEGMTAQTKQAILAGNALRAYSLG
jgi:predicted TIM-barrel fold metal-dependent hydrolase